MDLDVVEANGEETSDPQRECGSASAVELEVNFISCGEAQAEACFNEKLVAGDEVLVNSNQLGRKGSASPPDDFQNVELPHDKSHSLATEFTYDQERIHPVLKDKECQAEMDELSGNYFHKSISHSERRTEDSVHSQESPIKVDDNQTKMDGRSNLDGSKSTSAGEEVDLIEQNSYRLGNEPKNENDDSKELSTESGEINILHSLPHSTEASPLTVRQMSVSPKRSTRVHQSPDDGHRPFTSQGSAQEPSHPLTSTRNGKSSSHERASRHRYRQSSSPKMPGEAKEVPPREHVSSSRKQTSVSPIRSRDSPRKYGRRERSVSRSPVRRRESSSGYKREHRHRSRSRSPYKREQQRPSRGRYSPRQRSPPGYHSSRHSPRRRPWAPPPGRRTGLGKPGNILFVAGFSFPTTEKDLERKFSRFGRVRDVRIVRDKRSGDSRGFGFLSLEKDEDADEAIRALDETEWNGRVILVEKSKSH
ncbi:uncharacterized protein LOC126670066 [Mercurialis annua]|uniref:uncharacterized protein LOC126670066 n=1 Tax=Mercurialis annua TaxID=3986 RepID=UPI0021608E15|nr:uncharacterized protein LOC126670066 [Mercurialis annua]XP_050219679.1 uncharacterized protein LOC126670066 [Mercurialis annua]